MSPKNRSTEKSKLRMDDYSSNDKSQRQRGALDSRREIDKVIKKARRDGTQSAYWTKKLLEAEEKEPDRWHHSGYKELYVNSNDTQDTSNKGSITKRATMYSPSAPTSPAVPVRSLRRSSSSNNRRIDRQSVSPDVRRGSRSRTDKFSSSARTRSSVSPYRRLKSPNVKPTRSPICRSRSPIRRTRSPIRRSPIRRTSTSRTRKSPLRRGKSPLRSGRSPVTRVKAPGSRQTKQDKADRRNRSVDKLSPLIRRKKSPKLPRYKSSASRSPAAKSPKHRTKIRSRSPVPSKSAKQKLLESKSRNRRDSSSGSQVSSNSPYKKKKNNAKQALSSDVLSSSDCSDSNCSMCKFEKSVKEKRKVRPDKEGRRRAPPVEPKLKPLANLPRLPPTSSSRYARSRSFSVPGASSPSIRRVETTKHKKKSAKREKKKNVVKADKDITKAIIHHKKIKVESPSDESESPSPKRISLSDRFGKMAKWNQKKDSESDQRNIRVTAGDQYRVEELDGPLMEPFPEPSPLLLEGSWDDVRVRFTYYKEHGYLEDLSFQDYLKWEEWWYSYQEWLDSERLHSFRRRL